MGIRHLCDDKISDEEFQYFLNNLESFQVTEKVDGSNLTFGLDAAGEFYINRDKKDGRKLGNLYSYNVEYLGRNFYKYFVILYHFYSSGAISMPRNSEFEVEIVDDPITNVVPYDPHQIIILDSVSKSLTINQETIKPFHDDNMIYLFDHDNDQWSIKFNNPFKIDYDKIRNLFENTNRADALIQLKSLLLDIPSQYGKNNNKSWIEGLVFKKDDLIYKLVNKDRFTIMNKFLHEFRLTLSRPRPGVNSTGGIFQEMIAEIAEVYSMKELATSQKKRWIVKNPDWEENIIQQDQMFYSKNLIKITGIIDKYNELVKKCEDEYLKNYKNLCIDTNYGKCYIDEYTHKKNIESLTNLKMRIGIIEDEIKSDDQQRVGIWAFMV